MLYLFLILIALFFLSDIFFRKTFHLIYGKPIPRSANAKEVREFMMSMMDEAEKQISYEENYEIIVKQLYLAFCFNWNFLDWYLFPYRYLISLSSCITDLSLYLGLTIQDYQTLL